MAMRPLAVGDTIPYPTGPVVSDDTDEVEAFIAALPALWDRASALPAPTPTDRKVPPRDGSHVRVLQETGGGPVGPDGVDERVRLLRELTKDPALHGRGTHERELLHRARWLRMVEESTPESRAAWLLPELDPEAPPELTLHEVGEDLEGGAPAWPEPFASDPTWIEWSRSWIARRDRRSSLRRESWPVRVLFALSQLGRSFRTEQSLLRVLRMGMMPLAAFELHLHALVRDAQKREDNAERIREHQRLMASRAKPALLPELMAREQERIFSAGPELVGRARELGVTQQAWDEARRSGQVQSIFGLAIREEPAELLEEVLGPGGLLPRDDRLDLSSLDRFLKSSVVTSLLESVTGVQRVRRVLSSLIDHLLPTHFVVADGHLIVRGHVMGVTLAVLPNGLLLRRFAPASAPQEAAEPHGAPHGGDIGGELAEYGLIEGAPTLVPWSDDPELYVRRSGWGSSGTRSKMGVELGPAIHQTFDKLDWRRTSELGTGAEAYLDPVTAEFVGAVELLGRGRPDAALSLLTRPEKWALRLFVELADRRSEVRWRRTTSEMYLEASNFNILHFEQLADVGARGWDHPLWEAIREAMSPSRYWDRTLVPVTRWEGPLRKLDLAFAVRNGVHLVDERFRVASLRLSPRAIETQEAAESASVMMVPLHVPPHDHSSRYAEKVAWSDERVAATVRHAQERARVASGSEPEDWEQALASGRALTTVESVVRSGKEKFLKKLLGEWVTGPFLHLTTIAATDAGLLAHAVTCGRGDGSRLPDGLPPDRDDWHPWRSIADVRGSETGITVRTVTGETRDVDLWDETASITAAFAEMTTDSEDGGPIVYRDAIEYMDAIERNAEAARERINDAYRDAIERNAEADLDNEAMDAYIDATARIAEAKRERIMDAIERIAEVARARIPDVATRGRELEEAISRAQVQARIDSGSEPRDWEDALASGRIVTVAHALGRTVELDGQRIALRLRITTAAATDAGLVTHSTTWDATKGPDPRDGGYTQGEAELIPWRSISSIRRTAATVTIESVTGRTIRIDIADAPRVNADDPSMKGSGEMMTGADAIARGVTIFVEAAQRKIASAH